MNMNEADVLVLIAAGESLTVEFKGESREALSDRALVEAVVCLANGRGGVLLIGVEDDGRVTGARARHAPTTDPARLQALIANKSEPPVATTVSLIQVHGQDVILIEVEDSRRVVGTSSGLYLRRALRVDGRPECVPYRAHEMLAHEIDRGAVDFAALPAHGAQWDDLDPLEFERFRNMVRRTGGTADSTLSDLSDQDIARALGVVSTQGGQLQPTLGGVLLFGRADVISRQVPSHEAAFQVVTGTSVEVNDFLPGPLLRVADDLLSRVEARNSEVELQVGIMRVPVPKVPLVAVREAIANALVHRDYTHLGPVTVQWSEDALRVTSPGGFPSGVRLDNLLDVSQPRSPILAGAFKRAGLVERTGRGINRMYEAQLRLGRDAPDYSRSTEASVTAVLPTGATDLALARFFLTREGSLGRPMRLADLQILHELRRDTLLSVPEVATLIQETETQARSDLARLVEEGLVEIRGTGRGRRYHLAASVYRALDEQSAYVRVRSFEPIQQEQMITTFVEAHGSIKRSQAADLCALTPQQASTLLKRMSLAGQLELVGRKRGAHYVRPATH